MIRRGGGDVVEMAGSNLTRMLFTNYHSVW